MEKRQIFVAALVAALIFVVAAVLFSIIAGHWLSGNQGWLVSLNNTAYDGMGNDIYVGSDGTCYVLGLREITAINMDGTLKWQYTTDNSPLWGQESKNNIVEYAADKDGWLYAVLCPSLGTTSTGIPDIVAIAPNGTPGWEESVGYPGLSAIESTPGSLTVVGDRIYLQINGLLKVLDLEGRVVWQNESADASAIGRDGTVYTFDGYNVTAYAIDGSPLWTNDVPISAWHNNPSPEGRLSYRNGTLYLWIAYGSAAFDANGSLLWARQFSPDRTYPEGFDSDDRMFLTYYDGSTNNTTYVIISRDGTEKMLTIPDQRSNNGTGLVYDYLSGDIIFHVLRNSANSSVAGSLDSYTLVAYDTRDGHRLWSRSLNLSNVRNTTLDESTVYNVMYCYDADQTVADNRLTPQYWYKINNVTDGTTTVMSRSDQTLTAGNGVVCIGYWAYRYDYPFYFNVTPCTYAGGVFAFDRDGKMLWSKSTESYVTSMDVMNGTIYYQTNNGKLSSYGVGVAAGLIAAAIYLIVHFAGLGTVTRARARLDKNDKRTRILRLIVDRPGLTLYEIAKSTGVNLGTARYHLLVLSLNHRIIAHSDGTKFVRYFRNSNAYTEEEKAIIGLCRRDNVRTVLATVAGRPGLTNAGIAAALDVQDSASSRTLRELVNAGVVRKVAGDADRPTYFIEEKYTHVVADVLKSLDMEQSATSIRSDARTTYET